MLITICDKRFWFEAKDLEQLNDLLRRLPQGKYNYKTEGVDIDKDATPVVLKMINTTAWEEVK